MTRTRHRVLHLIDTGGPGGAETIFLDLAQGLSGRGWESLLVVPGRDWLYNQACESGLTMVEATSPRSFDVAHVLGLRQRIKALGVDLVQTHLLGTSVYAVLACAGTDVPVVSTFHGRPDFPEGGRLGFLKTRLLSAHRNRVVCVSSSLREYFLGQRLLPPSTRVIPNGVALHALQRTETSNGLRAELGIGAETPLVGAVGNVRPSKAYQHLLAAFAAVLREVPSARLVIAGECDGPRGDRLKRRRNELGLQEAVTFLGFRDDVSEVLASLDVFALSSLDEGFSLATVQAMALGRPVVATRSGGPEEIIGEDGPGVLVPPGDPEALAQALVRVLRDHRLGEELGSSAAAHVRSRFSMQAMLDAYEALYLEALGG